MEAPPWLSALRDELALLPPGTLWLGFSGGLDSSVLLHLLANLPEARARGLAALHIHHGLQSHADTWLAHCAATAAQWQVPFHACRVQVDADDIRENGLEAAARHARHAAFAAQLPTPGLLALAHHRDDQIETLMLRLLHGAGNEGLAGMRRLRPLAGDAQRLLWRPLLDVPRSALERYAQQHDLEVIHDPANAEPQHARNRLRHQVLPALRAAFPDADLRIAASARRLREEADALEQIARDHLAAHLSPERQLSCAALRGIPPALARRVLGAWLDALGLPRPPAGIWARVLPELVDCRADATPILAWRGAHLRRHRNWLYADDSRHDSGAHDASTAPAGQVGHAGHWQLHWDGTAALRLPAGLGRLQFEPALREPMDFIVRPRRGGEHLRIRGHQRTLKKLLQESGLPPWQRARLPLLFDSADQLLSVAARWHSDAFARWQLQHGTRIMLYPD